MYRDANDHARAHDSDGEDGGDGGYKHHSTRAAEFLRAGLREGGWLKGFIIIFVRRRRMHLLLQPT